MSCDQVRTVVQNYFIPTQLQQLLHLILVGMHCAYGSSSRENSLRFLNECNHKRVSLPRIWQFTFNKVWWIERLNNRISSLVLFLDPFLSTLTLIRKSILSLHSKNSFKAVKWKLQSITTCSLSRRLLAKILWLWQTVF